jgi:hypothetical protein
MTEVMATETALVLDEEQWADLAHVCNHFLYATRWAVLGHEQPTQALLNQREVCEKIVEATS